MNWRVVFTSKVAEQVRELSPEAYQELLDVVAYIETNPFLPAPIKDELGLRRCWSRSGVWVDYGIDSGRLIIVAVDIGSVV